jgi:hypothetical protein
VKAHHIIPCLGVCCELHRVCKCYHAVEFSDPQRMRIGHCPKDEHGNRTLFVPIVPVHVACVEAERRAAA